MLCHDRLQTSPGSLRVGGPSPKCGGCLSALSVAISCGDAPVVVHGVMGDVGVASSAGILRCERGREPAVRGGFCGLEGGVPQGGVSDSMESLVVVGCVLVSAVTKIKSSAM